MVACAKSLADASTQRQQLTVLDSRRDVSALAAQSAINVRPVKASMHTVACSIEQIAKGTDRPAMDQATLCFKLPTWKVSRGRMRCKAYANHQAESLHLAMPSPAWQYLMSAMPEHQKTPFPSAMCEGSRTMPYAQHLQDDIAICKSA